MLYMLLFLATAGPIDHPKLMRVIRDTYRMLQEKRPPVFVLNIEVAPGASFWPTFVLFVFLFTDVRLGMVDVNLTPDKRQVMVQEESELLETVQTALQDKLEPSQRTYAVQSILPVPGTSASQAGSSMPSASERTSSSMEFPEDAVLSSSAVESRTWDGSEEMVQPAARSLHSSQMFSAATEVQALETAATEVASQLLSSTTLLSQETALIGAESKVEENSDNSDRLCDDNAADEISDMQGGGASIGGRKRSARACDAIISDLRVVSAKLSMQSSPSHADECHVDDFQVDDSCCTHSTPCGHELS